MKLLVLAQTPPPVHGQSLMVQTLLEGLHLRAPEFELHPVDLELSKSLEDVGRVRPGKLFSLLNICRRVRRVQRKHKGTVLYYIPSPGKNSALVRDWLVMALCRGGSQALVLHWHASGLGDWLKDKPLRRWLTRRFLGKPDLSIALTPALQADTLFLRPRLTETVANGIQDPGTPPASPSRQADKRCRIAFVGACIAEKGIFVLLDALKLLQVRAPGRFILIAAGEFPCDRERARFVQESAALGTSVVMAGFVRGEAKKRLFQDADIVCLPSHYRHEAQPLVALEAMAADKKLVVTSWRGLPETVTPGHSWTCEPGNAESLADALLAAADSPAPQGAARKWWEDRFTTDHHLDALAKALHTLDT